MPQTNKQHAGNDDFSKKGSLGWIREMEEELHLHLYKYVDKETDDLYRGPEFDQR